MWFKVFEPKTQISDIFLIMIETKCDAGAVCASWGGPVTRVEEGTARVEAELARVKEGGRTCWGGDHVRRDGSRVCWGGGLIFCQESQCNFCIYLDWYKYSAQPELENEYHVFWFWSLIWILNLTVTCQIECARPVPTFFHKQCPCSFYTNAPKSRGRCQYRSIGVFEIDNLQSWTTYMRRATYVTFSSQHYHRNQSWRSLVEISLESKFTKLLGFSKI